ncbi:MAG: isoleucine--tRNA ligase [Thermoplasmata archaeon]
MDNTKFSNKKTTAEIELEILKRWKEKEIYKKRNEMNREGKKFTFLEGPPTANGQPHLGHALTRSIKDLVLRYHMLRGENIFPGIAGWDCHGLPVELEVEKHLKINSKKEIEKFGIREFNMLCKESVFKYKKEWEEMSERIGFWIDFDDAYKTMDDSYIESVWWAISKIWNMKMLEKSFKIVPYCPRCGTPLSSHEVAQGYKETEDPSIFVKFKVKDEDSFFLVWTTTPWTLPSNMFLAVNKNVIYCQVEFQGEKYYIAKERMKDVMGSAKIIREFKGEELLNKRYERPIDTIKIDQDVFFVVHGDFVSTGDGTGIVHIAPAFGADDFEIGRKYNVKIVNPVDREGRFIEGIWNGKFVKDADREIIKYLKEKKLLFRNERIKHTYPFCWRCGTPLLYYPLDTWYIKISNFRDNLKENNEKINWIPENIKHGRFGNFLDEAKDWALSRDRYWGTPLNIWSCKNNHYFVPSSFDELFKNSTFIPEYFEPHRPWVDEIEVKCPVCGEKMVREPYVIDVWFDSGSAPFAQFHYPMENENIIDDYIPVCFISEAMDQTRGWFYTLHTITSLLFNKNAYSNVITLGFVLNEKGEKMSKSKGDAVDPVPYMNEVGADALRLYFYSVPPWKDRRVSINLIREYKSKTIDTLLNSYIFYRNNAIIDNFKFDGLKISNEIDYWIISRLNSTVRCISKNMDNYQIHRSTECIERFLWELSNWYIRRSRRRFWSEKIDEDKLSAYRTMYYVFEVFLRATAPFIPFLTDYIYTDLTGEESVHLKNFPESDISLINEDLENRMEMVIDIIEAGRRARQEMNIKTRQPLENMIIISGDDKVRNISQRYEDIIRDELNVKNIITEENEDKYITREIKLNPTIAGPILKNEMKRISELLKNQDEKIEESVKNKKPLIIENFEIPLEAIIIIKTPVNGYHLVTGRNFDLLISKEIKRDLLLEGIARDIVRRIQLMRKELNLDYADKILLVIKSDDPDINDAINRMKNYIENETLSHLIQDIENGYSKEWEIDGKNVLIIIKKVNK